MISLVPVVPQVPLVPQVPVELYHYIANSLASATLTPRPFLTSKKHKEQFVLLRLWEQMNFYQEDIELFMSN